MKKNEPNVLISKKADSLVFSDFLHAFKNLIKSFFIIFVFLFLISTIIPFIAFYLDICLRYVMHIFLKSDFSLDSSVKIVILLILYLVLYICSFKKIKHTFWSIGTECKNMCRWFKCKTCTAHFVITDEEIYGEKYSQGPSFFVTIVSYDFEINEVCNSFESKRKLKLVPFKYKLNEISHLEWKSLTKEDAINEGLDSTSIFDSQIFKLHFDNGDVLDFHGVFDDFDDERDCFKLFTYYSKEFTTQEKINIIKDYDRHWSSVMALCDSTRELEQTIENFEKTYKEASKEINAARFSLEQEINSTIEHIVKNAIKDEIDKIDNKR